MPEQPENVVQFACSMEMTKYDVKNYLEKIYNIKVMDVRTRIAMGKTKRDQVVGYVTKEDDTKLAYVTLEKDQKFVFPDLFPSDAEAKEKRRDDAKALDQAKQGFKNYLDRNKGRPGTPGWFSI
jgi:large subunit ribosomal protein L23